MKVLSESVIMNLVSTISKPFLNYGIGYLYSRKNKNHFVKICNEELEKVKECTSLDSGEFFKFIESISFQELLSSYFIILSNPATKSDTFINNVTSLCKERVPTVKEIEFRHFLKCIEEIIQKNRYEVLSKDSYMFHIMTLIVQSNNMICDYISNEFEGIRKIISLREKESLDSNCYNEILAYHHRSCIEEYNNIKFTGISGAENKKNYKLTDLYVRNIFYMVVTDEFVKDNEVSEEELCKIEEITVVYRDMFNVSNRLVILGGAGYGKSTSMDYIFCFYEKLFNENGVLKVKLDLKDLSKKIDNDFDIETCIVKEVSRRVSKQQYNIELIEKCILEYLDKGKSLIIFDALDEIEMADKRIKVRDEVNNFCNKYKFNRYIITSREVGYLNNQFDDSFMHLRISQFNEKQILSYSKKWFKLQKGIKDKNVNDIVAKFMAEIEKARCKELVSNPIMLVLSLIVFKVENRLPHAKIDFYKKCIATFLTEREERKGAYNINQIADIYHNNLVMPRIAYYKFENERNNPEYRFSKDEITKLTFKAIEVPENEQIKWTSEVSRYIKYILERTELVRPIDEDKYDFTHKSFKEYFLAVYYSKCLKTDMLVDFIMNSIDDANNHELAGLIIQYLGKECIIEPYENIIDKLLTRVESEGEDFSFGETNSYTRSCILILIGLFTDNALPIKFSDRFIKLFFSQPLLIGYLAVDDIYSMENFKKRFSDRYNEQKIKDKLRYIVAYPRLTDYLLEQEIENHRILYLFSRLRLFVQDSLFNVDSNKIIEIMQEVIGEYKKFVVEYEEIYISLIEACTRAGVRLNKANSELNSILKELLSLNICIECKKYMFPYYMGISSRIINNMIHSKENFAAVFSIIPSSVSDYYRLISFMSSKILKTNHNIYVSLKAGKEQKEYYDIYSEVLTSIREVINNNISYDNFISMIKNINLYSSEYERTYYTTYQTLVNSNALNSTSA